MRGNIYEIIKYCILKQSNQSKTVNPCWSIQQSTKSLPPLHIYIPDIEISQKGSVMTYRQSRHFSSVSQTYIICAMLLHTQLGGTSENLRSLFHCVTYAFTSGPLLGPTMYICTNYSTLLHQTLLPSGQHSYFISGRSQVQISGCRPATLTEVFCSCLYSLQVNTRTIL